MFFSYRTQRAQHPLKGRFMKERLIVLSVNLILICNTSCAVLYCILVACALVWVPIKKNSLDNFSKKCQKKTKKKSRIAINLFAFFVWIKSIVAINCVFDLKCLKKILKNCEKSPGWNFSLHEIRRENAEKIMCTKKSVSLLKMFSKSCKNLKYSVYYLVSLLFKTFA